MYTMREIGENAGLLWYALGEHGSQTIAELVQNTGLQTEKVCIALGWLAKENKIAITNAGSVIKFELNSMERGIYYSVRRK